MADEKKPNFEFIAQSLGLWPIQNGAAAIQPGAIVAIKRINDLPVDALHHEQPYERWQLSMLDDNIFILTDADLADLERRIRDQIEKAARAQLQMQGGVSGNMIVGGQHKRFRQ